MKRTTLLFAALLTLLPAVAQAQSHRAALKTPAPAGAYALPSGTRFALGLDAGEGLVVRATGQDAIDLLYGATPAQAAQYRARNRQTEALFDELAEMKAERLEGVMGTPDPARAVRDVMTLLGVHQSTYGPMNRYEVVGSVARPGGGTFTYVLATFGTTPVAYRLVWKHGHLLAFYPGPVDHLPGRIAPGPEAAAPRVATR